MSGSHARLTRSAHRAWRGSTAAIRALRDAVTSTAVVGVAIGALVVGGATPAVAYWSAGVVPGSVLGATITQLQASTVPSLSTQTSNVTLTWNAAALADGTPAQRYEVRRAAGNGAMQAATGGCAGLLTGTTCTESGLTEGTWRYEVVARYADNWTSAASPTASIFVDVTAPTSTVALANAPTALALSGTNVYFNPAAQRSVQLDVTVTDAGSGPKSVSTGALTFEGQNSTGWSHVASSTTTQNGVARTAAVTIPAGTTSSPSLGIDAFDVSGNKRASTVRFVPDATGPVGTSVRYLGGDLTTTTVTGTIATGTDAGSGLASSSIVLRRWSFDGASCGTPLADYGPFPAPNGTHDYPVQRGECMQAVLTATDRVGNTTVSTGPVARLAQNYASAIAGAAPTRHWRMDDAAGSTTMNERGGVTGTYVGGPTLGAAGALASSGVAGDRQNSAVTFTNSGAPNSQYATATNPVSGTAFSIEFWMNAASATSQGTGDWFTGAGLVDAERPGVTDDFGVALLQGGILAAGMGTTVAGGSDTTVKSTASVADGAWHHVVFTRDAGTLRLYVDGVQVASRTDAWTGSIANGADLRIAGINSGGGGFTGSLDEVAIYPTALTDAQIRHHFGYARNLANAAG